MLPWVTAAELRPSAQIDERSLVCDGQNAYLRAYDLSPDGKTVALLATPLALFNKANAPSCLAIWDISGAKIIKSIDVSVDKTPPQSGFSPDVLFVLQGKELVVQNQSTVSVYETDDLTRIREIRPPKEGPQRPLQVLYANQAGLLLVSFAAPLNNRSYLEALQNVSEAVDLATGQVRGAWPLDDLPLAFSPDGKWAAVSDRSSPGATLGLSFFDVSTGRTARLKDPQLGFSGKGEIFGRLTARFLSKGELLVTPDGNFDRKGETAAHEIKLVSVPQGSILAEIKPKHYGPMGELAASADTSFIATLSRSIPPFVMRHHVGLPRSATPNLLVMQRDGTSFKTKGAIQVPGILALRENRTFDLALLRLSANGQVISLVQDYGLHFYRLN